MASALGVLLLVICASTSWPPLAIGALAVGLVLLAHS